ncbi:hypothetical protein [Bradyrhizobium sp. HKCCYLS20291]|uniref:hypothetical protein n=1 Tax=Bradyrhizobium sp. HKCCYLS20291 TaxID=3420766 RepID=UPI003EBD3829
MRRLSVMALVGLALWGAAAAAPAHAQSNSESQPAANPPPAAVEELHYPDEIIKQTRLRAFFQPAASCPASATAGLFRLVPGKVELVTLQSRLGGTEWPLNNSFVRILKLTDADDLCSLSLSFSKQVLRDGQWRQLKVHPHNDVSSLIEFDIAQRQKNERSRVLIARPEDEVEDLIMMMGEKFPDDPEPSCLIGAGVYAITKGGFQVVFREPRAALPFAVDQAVHPDERRIDLIFSTPTCRLTIGVMKKARDGKDKDWVNLVPLDRPIDPPP